MSDATLKERIRAALVARGGRGKYHEVMREVFPHDKYPRAFRYSSNGGPPGCAMAFGRAIREIGAFDNYGLGERRARGKP